MLEHPACINLVIGRNPFAVDPDRVPVRDHQMSYLNHHYPLSLDSSNRCPLPTDVR
jgi:hypothetical protein